MHVHAGRHVHMCRTRKHVETSMYNAQAHQCMNGHIHVFIHTKRQTQTKTQTHIYTCTLAFHTQTLSHSLSHTNAHAHTLALSHTQTHTHTYLHAHTTHIYKYTHTFRGLRQRQKATKRPTCCPHSAHARCSAQLGARQGLTPLHACQTTVPLLTLPRLRAVQGYKHERRVFFHAGSR